MDDTAMKELTDRCLRWHAPVTNWLIKRGLKFDGFTKEKPVPVMLVEEKEMHRGNGVPHFEITGLPLPRIYHEVAGNTLPKDTTMAEVSIRKVGHLIEQTTLGLGEKLYGFLSHPNRLTLSRMDVESAANLLYERKYYGPYLLVEHDESPSVIDEEYPVEQVAARIGSPWIPRGRSVLVQATPDVVRMVIGEYPCLKQVNGVWRAEAIVAPQLRVDVHGNLAVVDMINTDEGK